MTARTSMLENIRYNLAKSAPFESLYHHLQPSEAKLNLSVPDVSSRELADRFSSELIAVGGEVHRVVGNEQAIETIGEIVSDLGSNRVAVSDLHLLKNSKFPDVELLKDPSRVDLFAVDAGISTAQFAIAETGTLVLRSSMERHRLVSLVPPVHVCVLNAGDIKPTMHSVLEELSNNIDPTITFITGPSRTSDIELTLAIGVHGPKRLIVVLID